MATHKARTVRPVRFRYSPVRIPSQTLEDVITRQNQHDIEEARFRKLLDEQLTVDATGGDGVTGGPQGTPVTPYYGDWKFANENAGVVFIGRTNSTKWRFWIDDEDTQPAPRYRLEDGTTEVTGDMRFGSAFAGPVMYGRYRDAIYRLYVDDENIVAPRLQFEKINGVDMTLADFVFGGSNFGFQNKARPNLTLWEFYFDNKEGHLENDVRFLLESA